MDEVDGTLSAGNKDRFTQRLLNLKRELNSTQVALFLGDAGQPLFGGVNASTR
jgi:hypothetical protein